ncbi:MAG TPA: S-layer homology domain-containing protein [Thermoanaerobaculia bacterium]|nr:S-layer homology domain-containing protein [Thermoanaerobaculia bacterium]
MKLSPAPFPRFPRRIGLGLGAVLAAVLAGGATRIVQDQCGPFTDVTPQICPYVLEMYYLGITAGTSPTTFSPDATVTRGQAAVFVSKGVNQAIARSSRRAALGQWWTTSSFTWSQGLGVTPLPDTLGPVISDGADLWVGGSTSLFRVRASDGKLVDTGTTTGSLLSAMGRIFVGGGTATGALFMIDPSGPASAAVNVAPLPPFPGSLAFDGNLIWTANNQSGSVSIVTPSPTTPWAVTTVTAGLQAPVAVVFDGHNVWVSDLGACAIRRLDATGAVIQTVVVGSSQCIVGTPVFDGANLLVPTGDALSVVRAADGALVATVPIATAAARLAFDGERILVESDGGGQNAPRGLTLLRAADFAVLRTESFIGIGGPSVGGLASDGLNFWVTFRTGNGDVLARY